MEVAAMTAGQRRVFNDDHGCVRISKTLLGKRAGRKQLLLRRLSVQRKRINAGDGQY